MNRVVTYIYDDTFIDLISLIAKLIINKARPYSIQSKKNYVATLFSEYKEYEFDPKIAKKLLNKLSHKIKKTIINIYLSNNKSKEVVIYYFIKNSLKYKDDIFQMRNLKCVHEGLKISKNVTRETHKFKGFTRFKLLNNDVLYAEISPTNDIIFLLSKHFKVRLRNEKWVIKDVERNIYCIYEKGKTYYVNDNVLEANKLEFDENENQIEKLWKNFFNTISIKERENKKRQMSLMPKKHWKYIVEMEDVYEKSDK